MPDVMRMPAVTTGDNEAILASWLVEEGATFSPQEVLATIETAKASVEVEAESGGVLLKRLVPEGEEVAAGAPIAVTGSAEETEKDAAALLEQLGLTVPGAARSGESAASAGRQDQSEGAGRGADTHTRTFASPIARRLARESGLSISDIKGTGPNGRIVRKDVEAAAARPAGVRSQPAERPDVAEPVSAPEAVADGSRTDSSYRDVPHSRLRRAIAGRLTQSKQTVPHFYLRGTADVERLCVLRGKLNSSSPVKITLTDMVLKAVAHAHARVPAMNVIWMPDAVRSFSSVDLSVAIATDGGLLTPVVRSVDSLSLSAVAAIVRDQAERARAGRLRPDELEGGVATVTNLGMYGTEEFAAIINPPHAAMLAVGAVLQQPVARKGKVRVRRTMTVTLSVDHRPIDGVTAAAWMQAFKGLLEDPAQILL